MSGANVVMPNPRIPTVLGTLNIVFGILLIVSSLAFIAWTVLLNRLVFERQNRQSPAQQRPAQTEARLTELRTRLETEKDPQVRDQIEDQIDALDEEAEDPEIGLTPLGGQNLKDPRLAVPFWTDHVLSLILNPLMVAAGIGLVTLRPWGRKLALAVALLKITKLVVLTLVAVFLTVPLQVVQTRALWAKMEARSKTSMPMGVSMRDSMARTTGVMGTLGAVGFGLAGMVYPGLSLWLLNKRSVQAAMLGPGTGKSARDGQTVAPVPFQ